MGRLLADVLGPGNLWWRVRQRLRLLNVRNTAVLCASAWKVAGRATCGLGGLELAFYAADDRVIAAMRPYRLGDLGRSAKPSGPPRAGKHPCAPRVSWLSHVSATAAPTNRSKAIASDPDTRPGSIPCD
jgi:hypothetical protein